MNFFDILFKRIEGFFKSMLSRITTKLGKIRQLPVIAAKKSKDILQGIVKFIIKKPSELSDYVKLGGTYVAKRALLAWLLLAAAAVLAVIWLLIPFLQRTLFTRKLTVNTADFFTAAGNAEVYTEYGTLLYTGKLSGGAAQGDGRLYDDGVLVYQGGFADNEYSGNGKLFAASGSLVYDGGFSDSVYSGSGKLYDDEGKLLYEGEFSAGLYDGNGTEYYPSGKIRSRGVYTAGVLNGEGQTYAENGSLIYSGGFVNGKYSGSGELYSDGALKYVGSFVDGEMSGEGTEYSPFGAKVYSGGFSSGVYSGTGTLYIWKNGFRLEGQFENGLANGVCTIFRDNGEQIFTGSMVNGEISWYSFVNADKNAVQAAFTSASGERALSDGRTLVYYGDFGCGFIFDADGKPDRMLVTGEQKLYGAAAGGTPQSLEEDPGELYDSYAYSPTASDRRLMKYINIDAPKQAVCEKYLRDGIFVKLYLFDGYIKWYEIGAV